MTSFGALDGTDARDYTRSFSVTSATSRAAGVSSRLFRLCLAWTGSRLLVADVVFEERHTRLIGELQ
jgi:hypothetical protein